MNTPEFFEYLGIPREKISDMATTDAAHALGIASDTGRLAEGFPADILAARGNPLEDLDALRAAPDRAFSAGEDRRRSPRPPPPGRCPRGPGRGCGP
ncbi:amidohydrolase family protein [Streptomyces sp. NPDC020096]